VIGRACALAVRSGSWGTCWAMRGCRRPSRTRSAGRRADRGRVLEGVDRPTDRASGALDRRPQLDEVLEQLRPGDTLVVWRLDRLGRSLRHLIEVVTGLDERRVGFRSLRENIDTTTARGSAGVPPVRGACPVLCYLEREIIRDRTVAGLTAARARSRVGGRPSKLSVEQRRQARKMYDARELTVEQIGGVLGVRRTSIYRSLGRTAGPAPPATPARSGPVALVRGVGRPGRPRARAGGGAQWP